MKSGIALRGSARFFFVASYKIVASFKKSL